MNAMARGGESAREAGEGHRGVRVEGPVARRTPFGVEERSAGDHGGVVGGEASRGREHRRSQVAEPPLHCLHERAVAGDATTEHYPAAAMFPRRTIRLLHQRVHQRVLKGARDVRRVGIEPFKERVYATR